MNKDGYMESIKEMKNTMDAGKVLIDRNGNKCYLDYDSTLSPYIFKSYNDIEISCRDWKNYSDYKILQEPEQITDRYELMGQVIDRFRAGEKFLVRAAYNSWGYPLYLQVLEDQVRDYKWISVDENWKPIGEPQKFTRGYKHV